MKSTVFKILFLPATLAAISPTIAMTSCATISQWQIPFSIDGKIDSIGNSNNAVDHQAKQISSYAPLAYSYSSATTNDEMHAYCTPEDWENDGKFLDPKYYSINTNDISTINNTDKDNPKKLYQNINLLQMSNGVISVANNLAHLYSYLLTYQSRSDVLSNKDELAKKYGVESSKFDDLYDKTKTGNQDFFEFNFSINNLLTEGQSKIKFDASNVNFKFKDFEYADHKGDSKNFSFGPIANSDIEQKFVGKTLRLNVDKPDEVGDPLLPFVKENMEKNYGYDKHVVLTEKKNGDTNMVEPSLIRQIPIPVSQIAMQESFYNSTKTRSFLPNDWLIQDIKEVNDEISNSNAWNNFEKFTNKKAEVKSLSWQVNCSQNSGSNNIDWSELGTNVDSIFDIYKNNLGYSDFIVLANYSITSEKPADSSKPTKTDRALVFSGVSGIYPAFFFQNPDAFAKTEISIPNPEDEKNPHKEDNYFANKDYLDKRLSEMNTALIKHNDNEDVQKLLKYSFMEYDGTNWNYNVNKVLSRWLS